MALRERPTSPAPDSTDQLCAIESIWHSAFLLDPSGVPSSKYARRYHSPSHALYSILWPRSVASFSHRSANAASPRRRATSANSMSTLQRKNASQTLSPLPCLPTRFMPSFQSPEPISGKPCVAESQAVQNRPHAMLV